MSTPNPASDRVTSPYLPPVDDAPPEHFAAPAPLVVDVDRPLTRLDGAGRVRLLVRLHGQPVGTVDLILPAEPHAVAEAVGSELGSALAAHLAADELPATVSGLVDGLPANEACRRPPAAGSVTVVVTACRAKPELLRVLDSIAAQDDPPDEVILVDNRPGTSGLPEMLARLGRPEIRYVAELRSGLGNARNAGLAVTNGRFVAFTDDDVVLDPSWLRGLLSGFDCAHVACVTGLILPLEIQTEAQMWIEEFGGFGKGFARRRFDLGAHRGPGPLYPYNAGGFGSGANGAFRTKALRDLGGFDGALGTGTPTRSGEDLDVFLDVLAHGWAIVYEPAAVLWHAHHRDLRDLRRQVHGYGVGIGAIMAKRLLDRPEERRDLLRRLPAGLRYLLDPRSGKNVRKTRSFPRSLTLAEIAGVASGPVALWRSRRAQRRGVTVGAAA